jgi:poly(3-hydroxybutyrate) depolymerase
MRTIALLLSLLALGACSDEQVDDQDGQQASEHAAESAGPAYVIDGDRITVSGLSSGAYMAGQLHVAHSDLFSGAALLAGGPYYCAEGSIAQGLGPCVQGGAIDIDRLAAYAREAAASGAIDRVVNLADDPVWIFIGTADDKVAAGVAKAAADFYRALDAGAELTFVDDVDVVHGMPTLDTGLACDSFGTPFIHDCDYDAAGLLLAALYGELEPRTEAPGELRALAQPGGAGAEMLETGYLYVPAACAMGENCGVHVALHGCGQSSAFVGDAFASGAGYNEWAESNHLLVLYPQADSSQVAPMNPYGCWDWWGYTNGDYATRGGAQVQVIKAMLDELAGRTL